MGVVEFGGNFKDRDNRIYWWIGFKMCRNKEVKNDVKFFGLIIGRMELLFIEMRRL